MIVPVAQGAGPSTWHILATWTATAQPPSSQLFECQSWAALYGSPFQNNSQPALDGSWMGLVVLCRGASPPKKSGLSGELCRDFHSSDAWHFTINFMIFGFCIDPPAFNFCAHLNYA